MKNTNGFNYDHVFELVNENNILKWFREKLGMSEQQIEDQMQKFNKNPDIFDEFKYAFFALTNSDFKPTILDFAVNEPVRVQDYSAYDLFNHFEEKLTTLDVFNLMISMREVPCIALVLEQAGVRKISC